MKYLSYEQIVELHDELVKKFGGIRGIRENNLLESAVTTPVMAVFGKEVHKSVYDKAASYMFSIARNHPFVDGNKRTASAVALAFLRINGKMPHYENSDFEEFVVQVAKGKIDLSEISQYLKKLCSLG